MTSSIKTGKLIPRSEIESQLRKDGWSNMEIQGEIDPLGKDAHEAGAKLDAGKNRLSLVLGAFAPALEQVGLVGTYGANKYTDNGWLSVPNGIQRYEDALLRHFLAAKKGQLRDKDTQLLHAAHAAWNALAILTLLLQELEGSAPGNK